MAYEDSLFSLDMHDTLSTVYTHALSAGSLEEEELEAVREKVFEHLDTVAQRLMTAIVCMNEFPFVRCALNVTYELTCAVLPTPTPIADSRTLIGASLKLLRVPLCAS